MKAWLGPRALVPQLSGDLAWQRTQVIKDHLGYLAASRGSVTPTERRSWRHFTFSL